MKRTTPPYVYAKGRKGYLYFCRRGQKPVRMHGAPGSPEFAAEYALLMRGRAVKPAHNIRELILSYQASPKWKRLAANTRKSYGYSFDYFMETMAGADPARLKRVHIIEMRDALADTPTTANRRVAALSVLFEHAIDKGWMPKDQNPAKGVEQLATTNDPREPWPPEMIVAFRREAPALTRLIFELLLGTGQRIGDVLKMQWSQIESGGIYVRQTKTDKGLWVPFTPTLAAILEDTPRLGDTIVAQERAPFTGRPVSYQKAWADFKKVREAIGAGEWVPHELRHTAASEVASLPGMTTEHIKAITGHNTSQMAEFYARQVFQKARALEAQNARGSKGESGNED